MDEAELTFDEFVLSMIRALFLFRDNTDTLGRNDYFDDWKTDFDNWVMRVDVVEEE